MEQVVNILVDQVKQLRMEIKYDVKEMKDEHKQTRNDTIQLRIEVAELHKKIEDLEKQKPLIRFPNSPKSWLGILIILASLGLIPSSAVSAGAKLLSSPEIQQVITPDNIVPSGKVLEGE